MPNRGHLCDECGKTHAYTILNGTTGERRHLCYDCFSTSHPPGVTKTRPQLEQHWIDGEVAETERALRALTDPGDLRRYPGLDVLDPYFLASADRQALLNGICQAALQRSGADMANVQLFDPTDNGLHIAVQYGFERPFLDFFAWVDGKGSACAAAGKQRRAVMVPDVARSALFSASGREVMLDARALAVRSIPLVSPSGRLLGVFSCHYHKAEWPTEGDVGLGSALAKAAARGLWWQAHQADDGHTASHDGAPRARGRSVSR